MADNSVFDPGTGGDTYRSKDRAGVKTELVGLDLNPAGSEQLMATAALADGTSNPTTAPWAGMLMCFNGTTWDRIRGDTTNGMFVNVKATAAPSSLPLPTGAATSAKQPALGTAGSPSTDVLSIQGIASGTAVKVDGSAVTQPVSGTVTATGPLTDTQLRASAVPVSLATLPALVAGTAAIGKLAANSGVTIGDINLVSAVPAGTNNIGLVTPTPSTTGGWSKVKYAAQTTTKQAAKASAGTFGGYYAYNPNASVAYIQVFDVASGSVTLGSTAPDMIFGIPAGSAANIEFTCGINMATAITLACTTTATGSTAPSTGLDLTILFK